MACVWVRLQIYTIKLVIDMKRRAQPRTKRQVPKQLPSLELIETEEFKLLHKLFVPNNYLIKNNKVLIPYLINNLPIIIDDSQINLQLHLFISSIIVNYVNTWYLGKLNTDNWEFVQIVYKLLNDLTKELTRRVLNIDIHVLIDQICDIANGHIDFLLNVDPTSRNTLSNPFEMYLQSHIIFENELGYYRTLSKKITDLTLEPVNSKITSDLVNLLVSDLVFVKVIDKLASPDFILGLIQKANEKVKEKLTEEKAVKSTGQKFTTRIRRTWYSIYNFIYEDVPEERTSIFDTSIFRLVGTLTNFTQRKPLLAAALKYIWNVLYYNPFFNRKINSIAVRRVDSLISDLLSLENMSNLIGDLRKGIFGKNGDDSAPISLTELSSNIANVIKTFVKCLPTATILEINEKELAGEIFKVLVVFNFEVGADNTVAHEKNDLNRLLAVNIFDCIVGDLYPELLESDVKL